MFKKVKVVMLPTNEKANALWWSGHRLYVKGPEDFSRGELNHLYFLSDDEEIDFKKDYAYHVDALGDRHIIAPNTWVPNPLFCKKIIATTDKSLSKTIKSSYVQFGDNVEETKIEFLPQPSQSFIEKFVEEYNKGNVITEVMVEYNMMNKGYDKPEDYPYQECEILKVNPKDNTITIRKMKDSWNREEVIKLINKISEEVDFESATQETINEWIEENL